MYKIRVKENGVWKLRDKTYDTMEKADIVACGIGISTNGALEIEVVEVQ